VDEALQEMEAAGFAERLWQRDAGLWKTDEAGKEIIANALGWLTLDSVMAGRAQEMASLADEVRREGFDRVVLLGMGGSSLAPLVLAETFGAAAGYPKLDVLDSTDPVAIERVERPLDPDKTLFIVSSKSGSTIEPISLFEYFHDMLGVLIKGQVGAHFVAITDAGSSLEALSRERGFRRLFLNPPDVGGRYSALSYFGLVPASLAGIDVSRLLDEAGVVSGAIGPDTAIRENPALVLGATLGALARVGRDKVTFLLSGEVESFGLWIEQLIAESTGKQGRGLVPITGEPGRDAAAYGADRVFISIETGDGEAGLDDRLNALAEASHPVIRFGLKDVYGLGGQFLLWEAATAAAGFLLGINPFDQPDVESAKRLARARLNRGGERDGGAAAPGSEIKAEWGAMRIGDPTIERMREAGYDGNDIHRAVAAFLSLVKDGSYIGLLAYYDPEDEGAGAVLASIRAALGASTGAATQFGFGPRYLHSTGQLHKGGPDSGVFIIFTHVSRAELKVPGSEFGFAELESAQARGDVDALEAAGRPVLHLEMKDASAETLARAALLFKAR